MIDLLAFGKFDFFTLTVAMSVGLSWGISIVDNAFLSMLTERLHIIRLSFNVFIGLIIKIDSASLRQIVA
jgi:hypothetical protein